MFCILCEVKRLIHSFVIHYVPLDLVICLLVIDVFLFTVWYTVHTVYLINLYGTQH